MTNAIIITRCLCDEDEGPACRVHIVNSTNLANTGSGADLNLFEEDSCKLQVTMVILRTWDEFGGGEQYFLKANFKGREVTREVPKKIYSKFLAVKPRHIIWANHE
jgi:hypothetical protein